MAKRQSQKIGEAIIATIILIATHFTVTKLLHLARSRSCCYENREIHADVIPTLTIIGDALRNDRVLTWVVEGNK